MRSVVRTRIHDESALNTKYCDKSAEIPFTLGGHELILRALCLKQQQPKRQN